MCPPYVILASDSLILSEVNIDSNRKWQSIFRSTISNIQNNYIMHIAFLQQKGIQIVENDVKIKKYQKGMKAEGSIRIRIMDGEERKIE